MLKTAVVSKIIDTSFAEVTVVREAACGNSCASCGGGCSEKRTVSVKAKNSVNAALGDTVTVESRSVSVLKAAVLVYIFPLAVFLLAYFAADNLFGAPEDICVLISAAAFLAGCALVAVINRFIRRDRALEFVIIEIL